MSRLEFKPEKSRLDIILPLLFSGLLCFLYSIIAVDSSKFDFADQILFCCLTILTSNVYYGTLTSSQFFNYNARKLFNTVKQKKSLHDEQKKRRSSIIDDRNPSQDAEEFINITKKYTVIDALIHTIDFEKKNREIRLFISREEMWYILYPVSISIFIIFFCIPIYDVSCSLMLALGFIILGTYQECRRDMYWERSSIRRTVFGIMVLSAMILIFSLFILSYTVNSMQQEVIKNLTNNTVVTQFNVTENNLDYIQLLLHNNDQAESNSSLPIPIEKDPLVYEIAQIYQNTKKLESFLIRIPVWLWCFYTPFMLQNIPGSTRLPIVLEISQTSLGNICAIVILFIVTTCQINWSKFYNATTLTYIFIIPVLIWVAVYMILKSSRNKTIHYVACIIIVFSYLKFSYIISQVYHVHSQHVVRTFVFLAFVIFINILFTILFFRNENLAIRSGWDKYDQDELCHDSLSDFEDDSLTQNPERSYTIDDVLLRVTSDIQQTEHIIRSNKKTALSSTEMKHIPVEENLSDVVKV